MQTLTAPHLSHMQQIKSGFSHKVTLRTPLLSLTAETSFLYKLQEAQLSPSDRAMCLVSSNLANYHATVQKLLI